MNSIVPIALFGWIVIAVGLFTVLPPRRALLAAFIGAWLFLPEGAVQYTGLPDLTKISATSIGALLGALICDARRLLAYRMHWADLPIIAWCAVPMASSLTNGHGAYDGASMLLSNVLNWGIPYFLGRVYINNLLALRELALAILLGGLIYVPLCLFEIRMSPQLHRWIYGFHPSGFDMTYRWGGYRPMVFMRHGLMLGMWMTSAALVAVWLWRTGAIRKLFHIPMPLLAAALVGMTFLCKSTGAILLLIAGIALLLTLRRTRLTPIVLAVVLAAPAYMFVRASGAWDGNEAVQVASLVNEDRAQSLEFRLHNEDLLIKRAMQKPAFGWGGWGNWRVHDDAGRDITTSDGLWIITLGQNGVVGLASITAIILLPVLLIVRRMPVRYWSHPAVAPCAALAVLLILFAFDCLANAMFNPIFILTAGALTGAALVRSPLAAPLLVQPPRRRMRHRPIPRHRSAPTPMPASPPVST